ncbi:MAG: hypothetical protein J2P15_08460 [Micromonosporaceae bacterium]|nr:hypothetical protein [Micromonosporaceae bacterium]
MACIPGLDKNCVPGGALVQNSAQAFLQELANEATQAAADVVKILFAGWLGVPSPGVDQDSGPVWYLRQYTHWAVAAVAVGAVLISALRLALRRNPEEASQLGRGLAWMVVLAGAGVPATQLLLSVGDDYSTWILNQAADGDAGARLLLFAPAAGSGAFTGLTQLAVLGIAVMLWLVAITQILLLLARGAGCVILSGLLPLAGSVGITGGGRAVRDRYVAWLLALVLYKPVAATIYAAAFWILGKSTGQGIVQQFETLLMGLVTFAMALVALPALMRLIAPAVSVLTFGGGGGAAAGVAAASGAQLASGALRLSEARSGGGRGGGGGPTGATPTGPPRPGGGRQPAGAQLGDSQPGAQPGQPPGSGSVPAQPGGASAATPAGAGVAAAHAAYQAGPAATGMVGGTAAAGAAGAEGQS